MSHLTITVDGRTLMDGELGAWKVRDNADLEEFVANLAKAARTGEEEWSSPLFAMFSGMALRDRGTTAVDITTRGKDWSMRVTHP